MFVLLIALIVSGCTEEEFYEKEFLEAAGKTSVFDEEPSTDDVLDPIEDPTTSDGSDDSDDPVGPVCSVDDLTDASDIFTQNSSGKSKVDILWVVDNSGSMGDEQDQLAYNFSVFIENFLTKGVDFKMGITTTDTKNRENAGKLIGGDDSLLTDEAARADEAGFKKTFSDLIRVGIDGWGREKGLLASAAFFDRNTAFLRDDSYLVVVYVSDEEDQSSNGVERYVNYLQSLRDSAGKVKAYSIVNTTETGEQYETVGTRYISASSQTGGTSSSIKKDFYTTLSDIGDSIVALVDSFPLSGVPYNAEITVRVNGEVVDGWSYDSTAKTIKFDAGSVPAAGSKISISYKVGCNE